jgi:adenosylcobinamide-GDP ribazoletransferase
VRRLLTALASAFSYFSILPLGRFAGGPAPDAFALTLLPLVGAVVGIVAGLGGFATRVLGIGGYDVAYAVTFLLLVVLTGAIHIDGFLDSCDALFATASVPRRLEIMKDVHHGTFAVAGMGVLVFFWWAALQRFEPSVEYAATIAFVCAAARLAMIANAWIFPYARSDAPTRQFSGRPSVVLYIVMALGVAALGYVLSPLDALYVPAAILAGVIAGWWMSTKLNGGLTGDCYGFGVTVMEVLLLVSVPL